MILLIDNYDSFSYNLYQLIGSINPDIKVVRNDQMTIDEIRALKPERIILSPGPGFPKDAGICIEVAKELGKEIPIFGVCLGHQAIQGDEKDHSGSQISFPGSDSGDHSGRTENHGGDRRWRDHGSHASGLSHLWRPVSSGIHSDTGRT